MHEFFHNLSCPLAGRRGRAYLLHVLSPAHKTPGTQFVTARMALTREVGFKMDVVLIVWSDCTL